MYEIKQVEKQLYTHNNIKNAINIKKIFIVDQ